MSDIFLGTVCVLFILSLASGKTTLENRDVELQWNITPQSAAQSVQIVHPSNKNMFVVLGRQAYDTGAGFNGRYNFTGDTTTGDIDFVLMAVTRTDAGTYTSHVGITKLGSATLVVYLTPGRASVIPSVPVVGTDLVLKCTSQSKSVPTDNDLVMTYTWFLNGSDLSDDNRFVATNRQLTIKDIQRSDKGSKITCKAQETPTLPSDSSPEYTIDPEFGPMFIKLNSTPSFRPVQGTRFGPITCIAECKPGCSYQWSHNGNNIVSAAGVLDIPNIQRAQKGTYTCTARNKHGTTIMDVTVAVEFGPENITLTPTNTTYKPLMGMSLGPIRCIAECEPICSYQWTGNGNINPPSNVLNLLNIQRAQTGTYRCTASNIHGIKTVSVAVVVEFQPSNTMLNPDARYFEPVEGTRLGPVNCSADCEPACTYQWSRDGNNIIPASSVLDITSIQRGQTGSYTCTATNKHGTKTISVTITVKFSPVILRFYSKPERPEVEENQTIYFICQTDGYPVPTVVIYFERNSTVYNQDENLSTTLMLKNVNCLLTGYYFCVAINEIGNITMNSSINVLCPPRLDYRKKIKVIHGIENGTNVNITGRFIANPPPTFTWRFRRIDSQTETVLINGTESFCFINQQNDYVSYSSRAIRNISEEKHVGQYILQASNRKGSEIFVQTVFLIRHPNQPEGIAAVCTSVNTAEIIWISKFNGGKDQHFFVGVKTTEEEKYTIRKNLTDPGENVAVREVIDGLQDETRYFFTVYAENKYGRSMLSKDLECVTPSKVIEKNCRCTPNIASIVLFTLSAVFVVCVVTGLIISCFLKRKRNSPDKRPKRDTSKKQTGKHSKEMDSINAYQNLGARAQPVDTSYQELQESRRETDSINAYQKLGDRKQPVESPYEELPESKIGKALSLKMDIYQDLEKKDISAESQYQQLKTTKTENKQESKKGNIYDELGQKNPTNVYDEIKSQAK